MSCQIRLSIQTSRGSIAALKLRYEHPYNVDREERDQVLYKEEIKENCSCLNSNHYEKYHIQNARGAICKDEHNWFRLADLGNPHEVVGGWPQSLPSTAIFNEGTLYLKIQTTN